jgi:hypothetical protein
MVIYLCTGIGKGCYWGTESVCPLFTFTFCLTRMRRRTDDRLALRKHIETDMPAVMTTLTQSMTPPTNPEMEKEAEAACQCAESWVTYGIGAECVLALSQDISADGSELSELLPHLYGLLPLPAASSALVEVLSESIFKFGKGAKILTEPLLGWFTGPAFQNILAKEDGGESFCLLLTLSLLNSAIETALADDRTE